LTTSSPNRTGGETTSDNLALAVFTATTSKVRTLPESIQTATKLSSLFHPRHSVREDHFGWDGERITGLTAVGCATIHTLRLNHPLRLAVRRSLLREGICFT